MSTHEGSLPADAETLVAIVHEDSADQYAWQLIKLAIAHRQSSQSEHGLSLVDAAFAVEAAQRVIRDEVLARHATPARTR